ncbi:MAG: D-2-hydroxyacid dehydrogenase [Bryobacteraceae bacterium]|nr:D-2-hydroxyacid dehydrogenase [Bryobacteraceae bacterium]
MPVTRRGLLTSSSLALAAQAQQRKPVVGSNQPESNLPPAGPTIRILTMTPLEPAELARVTKAAGATKVELDVAANRADFRAKLPNAEVVFGMLQDSELDFAPKLKWIQAEGAGMEGTGKAVMASNLVITNMARAFAPGIAETGIGLLLCLTRGITTYYMPQFAKRQMKAVGTVKSSHYTELTGKTAAIVGMGGIGCEFARRLHYGFGVKVIATDARPMPTPDYVAELHDPSWFMEMVPQADILISAAPHTPKTERMFNEAVFRKMKKTSYFLGMSRGKLFDDMALVKALKEGWIAGAGLDVFPVEPPPADHPIYDLPNVAMTAHTSGWGPERQDRLIGVLAENVRRYAQGLPLMNVVDKPKGY